MSQLIETIISRCFNIRYFVNDNNSSSSIWAYVEGRKSIWLNSIFGFALFEFSSFSHHSSMRIIDFSVWGSLNVFEEGTERRATPSLSKKYLL